MSIFSRKRRKDPKELADRTDQESLDALRAARAAQVQATYYLQRADSLAREARALRHRNHFADRITQAYRGGA